MPLTQNSLVGRPWGPDVDAISRNVRSYGARGDGVTDDTAAIQEAINSLQQAPVGPDGIPSGGTLFFPTGTYLCNSPLTVAGKKGIRLFGGGGQTEGYEPASQLRYTGTTAPFIDARGSSTFEMNRMSVFYTNAGFTGTLIDCSANSFLVQFLDCILGGTQTSAARIIDFDTGNYAVLNRCTIGGAAVGIRGVASGASFSNVVRIRDTLFSSLGAAYHLTTAGIQNPGQGWLIDGCNFEPLDSGAPGAIVVDSAMNQIGEAVHIRGCWMGDATAAGNWITTTGNIGGLVLEGNYISGPGGGTVGLSTSGSFAGTGLVVVGNTFANLLTAVNIGNNTANFVMLGNAKQGTVTNQLLVGAGAIQSGVVHDWTTNHTVWYGGNTKSRQAPAFAASFTPNPSLGEIVNVGVLTANITINAPASPVVGQSMTFLFTQDGTGGRTVTWNAAFIHSWSDVGNTLNKRSSIQFVYDGTNWVQVGAQRVWA